MQPKFTHDSRKVYRNGREQLEVTSYESASCLTRVLNLLPEEEGKRLAQVFKDYEKRIAEKDGLIHELRMTVNDMIGTLTLAERELPTWQAGNAPKVSDFCHRSIRSAQELIARLCEARL